MDKLGVDHASYVLNIPLFGPGVVSSFRRSQTMPTLRAMCTEAIGARRVLTPDETSRIAAHAYRRAGQLPLECAAGELAEALGIVSPNDDPVAIFFAVAGALLEPTKAAGSLHDQCMLMLELAAPRFIMEEARLLRLRGGKPLPQLADVPRWMQDLLLGRRNESGVIRAITGRKSAV